MDHNAPLAHHSTTWWVHSQQLQPREKHRRIPLCPWWKWLILFFDSVRWMGDPIDFHRSVVTESQEENDWSWDGSWMRSVKCWRVMFISKRMCKGMEMPRSFSISLERRTVDSESVPLLSRLDCLLTLLHYRERTRWSVLVVVVHLLWKGWIWVDPHSGAASLYRQSFTDDVKRPFSGVKGWKSMISRDGISWSWSDSFSPIDTKISENSIGQHVRMSVVELLSRLGTTTAVNVSDDEISMDEDLIDECTFNEETLEIFGGDELSLSEFEEVSSMRSIT